jgi:hypothetical protein
MGADGVDAELRQRQQPTVGPAAVVFVAMVVDLGCRWDASIRNRRRNNAPTHNAYRGQRPPSTHAYFCRMNTTTDASSPKSKGAGPCPSSSSPSAPFPHVPTERRRAAAASSSLGC